VACHHPRPLVDKRRGGKKAKSEKKAKESTTVQRMFALAQNLDPAKSKEGDDEKLAEIQGIITWYREEVRKLLTRGAA
jgi:hypothetical protein